MTNLCTLVVCAAPLATRAADVAGELVAAGWRLHVLVTPAASSWIDAAALAVASGQIPRSEYRSPEDPKSREKPAAVIVVPITFNTVGKLAGGIADTLAHSAMCEALGQGVPILTVPMVNNKLWGHPAWESNLERLSSAGVRWLSIHDGTIGEPKVVQSGTGDDLVRRFDPLWITSHLPPPDPLLLS